MIWPCCRICGTRPHYTLAYEYGVKPFDLSYVRGINACLKRTAAINPGMLRTSENVMVRCASGQMYTPSVPDETALERCIRQACDSPGTLLDASGLFASLERFQPFGNGNKRTAVLAANGLIVRAGGVSPLEVPVESDETREFNELLSAWYVHDDPAVIVWLASWNEAHSAR